MHSLIILGTAVFTFVTYAQAQSNGLAMYKRQDNEITSIGATSTTTFTSATPTTTSQPDEVHEAVNMTLDGQIFPPSIQIEGVSSTSAHPNSNETSLVPIPLNATRSDLDIAIEVGFRPSVTFVVALGDPSIIGASVSLDVGLDIPKLDLDIKQVHNVTSNCEPAAPSLLSDPKDDKTVYENLTLVAPSLGLDFFEVFNESANFLGAKLKGQQPFNQSFSWGLPTVCLFFDAAQKTLGPASVTKPAKIAGAANRSVVPFASAFMAVTVSGFMLLAV